MSSPWRNVGFSGAGWSGCLVALLAPLLAALVLSVLVRFLGGLL